MSCLFAVLITTVTIIIFLRNVHSSTEVAYEDLQGAVRPLPDDLQKMIQNKSQYEIDMEDCMKEFSDCMKFLNRDMIICARSYDGATKLFHNICELIYEDCKLKDSYWHYVDDDKC
ncbi:hypothetical protein ACJJTC_014316 [Scirpophaga incertulas]